MITSEVLHQLITKAKSVGVRVNVYDDADGLFAEFSDSESFDFTGDSLTTKSTTADVAFIDAQLDMILKDRAEIISRSVHKKSKNNKTAVTSIITEIAAEGFEVAEAF